MEKIKIKGGMIAILGLDSEIVKEICQNVEGIVEPVNFNCKGQTVIAGEEKALEEVCKIVKSKKMGKISPLKVSGPFHSLLMKPVEEKLKIELEKIKFKEPKIPIISNVIAKALTNVNEIKRLLVKQVSSPVFWEQSIKTMLKNEVNVFIELGSGKALTSLLKRIDKNVKSFHIEDMETLKKGLEILKTA